MDKKEKIQEVLLKQNLFEVYDVTNINHKPHPYVIGPSHISNSSGAYLDIEECERKGVKCAHPNCYLSYKEHTSDLVCFLKLKRNGTNEEANTVLKNLVNELGENFVDGFSFIEIDEKFRINN